MNRFFLAAALTTAILPAAPALADPPSWAYGHGHGHGRHGHDRDDERYGRHYQPRSLTRNDHIWRGRDGQYHCRRSNGTTGLVVGAIGGALVGRTIDTRGDRTLGTLLGAAGGGLLGREIDRGGSQCR
ncbi:MAG: glycine zipper 2TM domain-containing protein [Novosphingobium sp.]